MVAIGGEAVLRLGRVKVDEIRKTYLSFFEERGHRIVPSASLVPSVDDPSVLLTTAGMQPFKPYFKGEEKPPAPRVADVQRCFRTVDIDEVGNTARHLTFFEMLGNWSFGDYFKEQSIAWGWELSTEGFGFDPELIWVSVFEGDEELGLGPDAEAIEIWRSIGVPEERIVALPRSENFWQAGDTGPCGPCSEMYLDRGPEFGRPDDRPGDDTDRYLEYWNHVFMTYDLAAGRLAQRAADEEHRHRHGPRADGGGPPGGRVGLRHRFAAADRRPRRGAVGPLLHAGCPDDPRDAHPRRSLSRAPRR